MAHNATGMTYDVPQSVDQGIDLGLLNMLSTVDLIDTQLRFDGTARKRLTMYNLEESYGSCSSAAQVRKCFKP